MITQDIINEIANDMVEAGFETAKRLNVPKEQTLEALVKARAAIDIVLASASTLVEIVRELNLLFEKGGKTQ